MIKSFASLLIYSFILIFSLSSCTALMSKMYGVNQIDGVNEEEIHQFYAAIDFKGIQTDKVIIDSSAFQSLREHENDSIKKDLSQPVQIHYFNNSDLASFHANCYAKGSLKNLDWNYQNRFESFFPISAVEDLNTYPSLQRLNKMITDVDISSENEIVITVFWTRMLEDISRDAVNTVLANISEFNKEDEVRLILINTDSFFSKI
ncbi:hypothetical protein QYS49_39205 [Marivirga salinae]|uniref:Lipoprotein n=1 Tax=Marivirga salinarum TaxID=3059078 RepID=A0AA51NDM2_9BACT|nr:hypothetical protein [Marivirga sp. BDSF4-3]WMN11666.1 hypothetical protein QYS49_39205 [Marivirga sp. BDSF4-3]